MEIEGALRVNARPPTRRKVLRPILEFSKKLGRPGLGAHLLGIDSISKKGSGNGQVLNVHTVDGSVSDSDGRDGGQKHTGQTCCISWRGQGQLA